MNYLNKIGELGHQRFFLTGNANQRITMTLRYMPTQQAWFMDVVYNDFTLNGVRVVNSPNLLRKYRNVIPFGFLCDVADGLDPYYLDDFAKQRAYLYLLNEEDVANIEGVNFQ